MKQQVLFFFFTLMLTGISVSAQTGGGRIAGVVIDNAGEEPLPGATIFIEELKKGIVTDGHGEFLLSDVPAATYTLTVRFIGYHTQTRKLTVGKERGKKIIIRLKAEAKSLDEVVVMGKSEARKLREQALPIPILFRLSAIAASSRLPKATFRACCSCILVRSITRRLYS